MPPERRNQLFRSLKRLEATGSTSRVLNLAGLGTDRQPAAFFATPALAGALIIKHRLRPDEEVTFARPRHTGTKVVIPFERTDLGLGGRVFFVGQRGWAGALASLHPEGLVDGHDHAVLEALDELPSLDPFLMREHLKRRGLPVAASCLVLSTADIARMEAFVRKEVETLVNLACGRADNRQEAEKLVDALLSGTADDRTEALRAALRLTETEQGDGLFCWRGLLYYKWSMAEIFPAVEEMLVELGSTRVRGPRTRADDELVQELVLAVRKGCARHMSNVREAVERYDQAYARLRDEAEPGGFCDFLLDAPASFQTVGRSMGLLSHAASYWRYCFPADAPRQAPIEALTDILVEYEFALS